VRKIIHVDMDCFYAAVEARDNPNLKNVPLAVGGRSDRRGVIATCNYIAREFGVHSALSSSVAKKRCPDLIIVPPNLNKYRNVSKQILEIFSRYTSLIEPLSLDEAYLDVSESTKFKGSATLIAKDLKEMIEAELSLTASAGVAPNKFLAKIASDWNKPNGLMVITPEQVESFVFNLPVNKIHGVGKVTARKLNNLNFRSCGDLQEASERFLTDKFGRFGRSLYRYARGIDEREVKSERERKSISVEKTFSEDCKDINEVLNKLPELLDSLKLRIARAKSNDFRSLFIKIKFSDFTVVTRERRAEYLLLDVLEDLIREGIDSKPKGVRLLGVGVRLNNQVQGELEQLSLPFY